MEIIITYKSGHKRKLKGCDFVEINTYDKRGFYYEKPDKHGHNLCYDDVLTDKAEKIEVIMKD